MMEGSEKITNKEEMGSRTLIVSRHAGAEQWFNEKGFEGDLVSHLTPEDLANIKTGDRVIGTLPIHMAEQVCSKRGKYFHLSLNLPPEARGQELSPSDMDAFNAELKEYLIVKVDDKESGYSQEDAKPKTLIVSRHTGAKDWFNEKGFEGEFVSHFTPEHLASLKPGDRIIGTLPIPLVAKVTKADVNYFNLSLNVPPEARGQELSPSDMDKFGARLDRYEAHLIPSDN